jgi:hypothetical protein
MERKIMLVQAKDGQEIRVTIGEKPSRMIDPSGVLAVPPKESNEEIKVAMSKFIQQYKNGEIQITYP